MADWLIWQLADSAFPAGSFAHSCGLEAACQQGEVDRSSLASFVEAAVIQAAHGAVPFVTAAHGDPSDISSIDERYDAFLRNPVANRASRVQGRAWLATVERAFALPSVRAVCQTARASAQCRHYAPMFGATVRALEVPLDAAQRLYLFGISRGVLSAAIRLGLAGPTDAQRLLAESAAVVERTLARSSGIAIDDAAQTSPIMDLWQAGHDRLYSRIFQS